MATEPESNALDLRDYLRILSRRKVVVALVAFLALVAALALDLVRTPVYHATAEILVRSQSPEEILSPGSVEPINAQRLVDTELRVLQSQSVENAAKRELGRDPDVSVSSIGQTDVIAITAASTDKAEAAEDANTYTETYIDLRKKQTVADLQAAAEEVQAQIDGLQQQIDDLVADEAQQRAQLEAELAGIEDDSDPRRQLIVDQLANLTDPLRTRLEEQQAASRSQLGQLQAAAEVATQVGGAELVTRATRPENPVSPQPVRDATVAVMLGLLLGIGIAFLREYLDDGVKTKEDVEATTGGLAVLGLVPGAGGRKKSRDQPLAITATDPSSATAEAYRTLRTSIQFLSLERPIRVLQFTSALSGEGKTTGVANLAITLAQSGQRVAIVCCDLRRPRIHEFFGLNNDVGLTSVLLGEAPLSKAVQRVPDHPAIAVLASGPPPPDPSELLSLRLTRDLIAKFSGNVDMVLVDSPPVIPVSDPLIVSGFCDATLVVARAGVTTKRALRRAVELLRQIDAPLVGTVLNSKGRERGYQYGYATYGRYTASTDRRADNGRRSLSERPVDVGFEEPSS